MLRRELQRLKLAVAPTARSAGGSSTPTCRASTRRFRPYYRDIIDHLGRALEQIDTLREMLSFGFEASLLIGSARQGKISRRLAGWAAILAVPTAIAGIYGMNFETCRSCTGRTATPAVLGVIAVTCGYLYYRFRRAGWI